MHLVGFLASGTWDESGGWRHPATDPRILDSQMWEKLARTLEDARFDAAFFADAFVWYGDASIERGGLNYMLDPLPLAVNLLRVTTHLGVGVTYSTTFYEPFGIARTLGTVDYLSGGRFAWNVVTSTYDAEARRFGMEKMLGRAERYDRAEEVVEACQQLWDSFPAEALVLDKESGQFIDPSRLKPFTFRGKHVSTEGPLTVPASPQGGPVIMQAGASERGRQFAARVGEMIFTLSHSLAAMQDYYSDMKRRVVEAGRQPDDCKIIAGIDVTVAETEQIAREQQAYADSMLDDDVAIEWTSASTGANLRAMPPDALLDTLQGTHEGSTSYLKRLEGIQRDVGRPLTIREASREFCLRGTPRIVGNPEQVADEIQALFEAEAADGFMLGGTVMPRSLETFAQLVVPVLQERGLFRTEYPGTTLRDTLRGARVAV
jgi:FMN-dependent oxidoreductase (nitrilotriacetate monooxygenase family)